MTSVSEGSQGCYGFLGDATQEGRQAASGAAVDARDPATLKDDCEDDGARAVSKLLDDAAELQLLWCAFETTVALATHGAASSASTASDAAASHRESHAAFVREVTQLLWGGEYPAWMTEQWLDYADFDIDDDEGEAATTTTPMDGVIIGGVAAVQTQQTAEDAGPAAPPPFPLRSSPLVRAHETCESNKGGEGVVKGDGNREDAHENSRVVVPSSPTPVAAVAPPPVSWTLLMRQALDALELQLPLQSGLHQSPSSTPSSCRDGDSRAASHDDDNDSTPICTLATHLVQDAPLLWLRFLLVPMYTQWTRQRLTAGTPSAPGGGGAADAPAGEAPLRAGEEVGGAITMHRLLDALGTATLKEALRQELVRVDLQLALVTAALRVEGGASRGRSMDAFRTSLATLRGEQRQHVGQLLYFAGTLAKAAQSFLVLGQGGFVLLATLSVRLIGDARAAWAEWAGHLHSAEVRRLSYAMCGGRSSPPDATVSSGGLRNASGAVTATEEGVEKKEEEEGDAPAPPAKRARSDGNREPAEPAHDVAEALAALRVSLQVLARSYAETVWRSWYLLYGYYGADLYTAEGVVHALQEREREAVDVRHLSAAQQAERQRLQLASEVKLHALTETHWLWCCSMLTNFEATLAAVLRRPQADSAMGPADVDPTERLYQHVLEDAVLHTFVAELRNTLRLYGQAVFAVRSGAMQEFSSSMPSTMQSTLGNVMALQEVFAQGLRTSLTWPAAAHPSPGTERTRGSRDFGATDVRSTMPHPHVQLGAYLWQLYPTLLRVQAPDEMSWLSSGGIADGGGDDAAEAVALLSREQLHRHWWHRQRCLKDLLRTASGSMRQLLQSSRRGPCAAPKAAGSPAAPATSPEGETAEVGPVVADLLASSEGNPTTTTDHHTTSLLADVSEDFWSFYDESCFVVLRPERQRLLTRLVQRLHRLLLPLSPPFAANVPTSPGTAASATVAAPAFDSEPSLAPLLRRDARLWMLLSHAAHLLLERRGRTAREDDELLTAHLLPLLSWMSRPEGVAASRQQTVDVARTSSGDANVQYGKDGMVLRDLLLLLASGFVTPPWGLEQLCLTVRRHAAMCAEYRIKSSPEDVEVAVAKLTAWLAPAAEPTAGAAAETNHTVSLFRGSVGWHHSNSYEKRGTESADSTLAREVARLDALCRQVDTHDAQVGDEVAAGEAHLHAALAQHARTGAAALATAPCGLLMVIGAYRSCGYALYRLRAALAEQHRMANESDVREYVGRPATFCTSDDIAAFRGIVTAVHTCAFNYACQPRGLLRLWLGYLQHLFLCLVPRSSASTAPMDAATGGSDGAGELVLMPTSWQRQQHRTSLFGARVYRTGWRALQHDGEPASQTRLREVLGESLADLMLQPYADPPSDGASETDAAAATTRAILQYTLPHAVLEILCDLLGIPTRISEEDGGHARHHHATTTVAAGSTLPEASGRTVEESFLGLAGLLAFVCRLERRVVPGSVKDDRLTHLLRCVYAAADAAAMGV